MADFDPMEKLRANFDAFVRRAGDDPARLFGVAKGAARLGLWSQGRRLLLRSRDLAPQGSEIHRQIAEHISAAVPAWHSRMLRDDMRNAAFYDAIRAVVGPGDRVLDIGTGSGLLAMMAARAGAEAVIGCERDPILADLAERVIERNGLADRIRIVAKPSDALDAETDLGGPVDVIIAEVIANNLLLEGVLPTIKHAAGRFLRPGGRIVPHSAEVMIALCEWEDFPAFGQTAGFDLGEFNELLVSPRRLGDDRKGLHLRSKPEVLFGFDFSDPDIALSRSRQLALSSTGGAINGVVQWLRIALAPGVTYENHPLTHAGSHWTPLFYPIDRMADSNMGASVALHALHDEKSLSIRQAAG